MENPTPDQSVETIRDQFLNDQPYLNGTLEQWSDVIRRETRSDISSDTLEGLKQAKDVLEEHCEDQLARAVQERIDEIISEEIVSPLKDLFLRNPLAAAEFQKPVRNSRRTTRKGTSK